MDKFFDPSNNRLVYIGNNASTQFWDSHWEKYNLEHTIKSARLNRMIRVPTRKYLPKGSRLLEGGCGLGQNVWSLHKSGYDVYGVDFAKATVEKINRAIPELQISFGDLRSLEFESDYFDGYWSLGVIEHFYDGYDAILNEMKRVIKSGGFLFLTFPCMSKFRVKKSGQGRYLLWKESRDLLDNFYQFALPVHHVVSKFQDQGFRLVKSQPIAGLKGFKDEIEHKQLKSRLQKLYDSKCISGRVLAWGLDQLLAPFAGHSHFLIFKNLK